MKYEITKGSEKDFEQAPEWATKVLRDNNDSKKSFVGDLGGVTLVAEKMNPHSWWKYNDGYVGTIMAERRPITEPVWDGEGLMPLVGMKCLAKQCSQINADEFLVVAIQDGAVFGFWTATGAATGLDVNRWIFLPIRSPEDVARDEAAKGLVDFLDRETDRNNVFHKHELIGFYDYIAAGKIPGVKLE